MSTASRDDPRVCGLEPPRADIATASAAEVVASLSSLVLDGGTEVPVLDVGTSTAEFVELAETILGIRACAIGLAAGRTEPVPEGAGPIAAALRSHIAELECADWPWGEISDAASPDIDAPATTGATPGAASHSPAGACERHTQLRLAAMASEHAALTMTIFDRTGRYVYANKLMCEFTGYTLEELLQMHVWDTAPAFTLDRIKEEWDRLGPSRVLHTETVTRRKDGTTYPIEADVAAWQIDGQELAVSFGSDITERKAAEAKTAETLVRFESLMEQTVRTIALIVEARDPYTAGHQERVGELAMAIGRQLGLDEHTVAGLQVAGQLHDVGKTAVPSEILAKPVVLSPTEFEIVKGHAEAGHAILDEIDFPWPVAEMVWQHHERLDGSGYPRGLADGDIMLEARILAVADVVEAMSAHRPYRPGLGVGAAMEEIECGSGVVYDPEVVQACQRVFRDERFDLE